jgi:hypothetical protein
MAGRVVGVFKVGDQLVSKTEQYHLGLKEGQLVTIIKEDDWGLPIEDILSPNMRIVYACVELDPNLYDDLVTWAHPIGETIKDSQIYIPDKSLYRRTENFLSLEDLQTHVGDVDLITKLRAQGVEVPMIDGKALTGADLKSSLLLSNTPIIRDLNAITAGSYGVGSGDDYSDWAAAFGDIGGDCTANLTFTQSSDTSDSTIATYIASADGYTFKCTSGSSHAGDPTAGHASTSTGAASQLFRFTHVDDGGGSVYEFEKLRILRGENQAGQHLIFWGESSGSGYTAKLHDLMIDGVGYTGGGITFYADNGTLYMWNCVIWDTNSDGMFLSETEDASVIEYCTFYDNNDDGIDCDNEACTVRNCASFGNGSNDFEDTGSLGTFSKCASSDTTGSEVGLRSLTTADQFISIDDTSSSFLDLDTTGALDEAGDTNQYADNTAGIRERSRPNGNSTTSIGATEITVAVASAVPVISKDGIHSLVMGGQVITG